MLIDLSQNLKATRTSCMIHFQMEIKYMICTYIELCTTQAMLTTENSSLSCTADLPPLWLKLHMYVLNLINDISKVILL